MRVRRALVKALAILAMPIVEDAISRIYRRREAEARELGITGIREPFYRIFGPSESAGGVVPAHDGDDPQPRVQASQPCFPNPRPSAEVVQFDRRSAS